MNMKNIVNIINFVRGVEPREGRNINLVQPVREQVRLLRENGLRGTFLLQYDAMLNDAYVEILKSCQDICELGVWLEIVQPLVENIGQTWKGRYPWDWYNDVGFLIGYQPEERIFLIDEIMSKFYKVFGYYPQSVGAWHVDAVSLAYLEEKYHIKACCICRDQVGTDGYTMQGGYFNQAYPQCTRGHTPRTVIFSRFSLLFSIGVRSSTPHSSALKIEKISTVEVAESERDEFECLQGT